MLAAALFMTAAQAVDVRVNGGGACLATLDVQLALGGITGLIQSDRVVVDLLRREEGPWRLFARVIRRDVEVWQRQLNVSAEDCPSLPAALARTLERGLDGVPRWPLDDGRPWQIGGQLSGTWPYGEWTVALTVGRGPRAKGALSWELDVGGFSRSVQPVGMFRASLSGILARFGPGMDARIGATRVGARPWVSAGLARSTVRGLDGPLSEVVPRSTLGLDARVQLPQGLRFGLRLSYSATRIEFIDTESEVLSIAPEPRWRGGFFIGYRGSVGQ
ncbi:MAG: hypothetical protein AAGA48_34060 [Myxococcota bacterium]